MRRRNFVRSLFGAASLAATLKLPGRTPPFDPTTYKGEVSYHAVLPQEKLDWIYRELVKSAAKSWELRYRNEYSNHTHNQ